MACTDCGFSTAAGAMNVPETIVYAKLASMVKGAALAGEMAAAEEEAKTEKLKLKAHHGWNVIKQLAGAMSEEDAEKLEVKEAPAFASDSGDVASVVVVEKAKTGRSKCRGCMEKAEFIAVCEWVFLAIFTTELVRARARARGARARGEGGIARLPRAP